MKFFNVSFGGGRCFGNDVKIECLVGVLMRNRGVFRYFFVDVFCDVIV